MSVEDKINKQYEEYQKEEKELQDNKVHVVKSLSSAFLSIFWIAHHIALIGAFAWFWTAISKADSTQLLLVLYAIFGILGLISWTCFGLYEWFDSCGWCDAASDVFADAYKRHLKAVDLRKNHAKRAEFFKFYELYQMDENFREQYNVQMSKKDEEAEFLKRLNQDKK